MYHDGFLLKVKKESSLEMFNKCSLIDLCIFGTSMESMYTFFYMQTHRDISKQSVFITLESVSEPIFNIHLTFRLY